MYTNPTWYARIESGHRGCPFRDVVVRTVKVLFLSVIAS